MLDLLLPQRCVVCGTAGRQLCAGCRTRLPALEPPFDIDPLLEKPARPVYLADMQEFGVRTGPWRFGKGELGNGANTPIKLKGTVAEKGLSAHPADRAATRVASALGGKAATLTGTVALSDSNPDAPDPVVFVIVGDRKELWRSNPIKRATGPESFRVDVTGVKVLELRAEFFDIFNHANFGQPGRVVASSTFGQITNTRFATGDSGSSRQMQFALKFKF